MIAASDYGQLITDAITIFDNSSPRTIQSTEGLLGPSDIGFCRQKAVLTTRQVIPTDDPPMWAANVGTAIHAYVETALKKTFPHWLVGSIDHIKVTATLPSGASISGHPDIVIPEDNTVLDIKTVDGFEWTKRSGPKQSHLYQRHLYAMGCLEEGLLYSTKPIYVGNVYFDRSGKIPHPLVYVEEYDPTLTDEIDSWVQDVIYAVKNNEDGSRDVPAPVCRKICSHFTACRGELKTHEGGVIIDDKTLVSAIDMYIEGRDLGKKADQMKQEAQAALRGINGSTGTYQVRWVEVGPTTIKPGERSGYSRMDVIRVNK